MMYFLYGLIVASVAALDQFFKYWVVANISLGDTIPFLPGLLSLSHIHNTGAAFSILEDMRWLLLAITAVSIIGIIIYMVKAKLSVLERTAISFILGGAIGNAIDRILLGYVVDMFNLDFITYPIFNIADCFIVIGGTIFCICFIINSYKDENGKKRRDKNHHRSSENTETDDIAYDIQGKNADPMLSQADDEIDKTRVFVRDTEFKMDPASLAMFDPDYDKKHSEAQSSTNQVEYPENTKLSPKPYTVTVPVKHHRSKVAKSSDIEMPNYEMPVFKPQKVKHHHKASSVKHSHEAAHISAKSDDLSLTKQLDLEFNKIFNESENGNDQN